MFKNFMIVALCSALAAVGLTLLADGQNELQGEGSGVEVRVNAKRLADGRTEFAVQQREGNGWSDRIAPRGRFLPAAPPLESWLNSTPITVGADGESEVAAALLTGSPFAPRDGLTEVSGSTSTGIAFQVSRDEFRGVVSTWVAARAASGGFLDEDLVLRIDCSPDGELGVLLGSADFLFVSGTSDVSWKFDSGLVQQADWVASRGGYAAPHPSEFLQSLRAAERLTILMPEYSQDAVTMDVRGMLATPLQPNLDNCGG